MNIHRLALVKWLLRAVSGALSADGDATSGTSTEDLEEEADHPPLEELKARCDHAWNSFPFKVGTQPFKAEVWNYFCPCEDLGSVEDVKCIFLEKIRHQLLTRVG